MAKNKPTTAQSPVAEAGAAASQPSHVSPPPKTCLVTIGATASFPSLLRDSISPAFLDCLIVHGYRHLILQCGPLVESIDNCLESSSTSPSSPGTSAPVSGFSRQPNPPGYFTYTCPSEPRPATYPNQRRLTIETTSHFQYFPSVVKKCVDSGGVLVGHAGSGTILDALTGGARMIAVPNTELMGNHQEETAEEFGRRGMVVRGEIGRLVEALEYSEKTPVLKAKVEAPAAEGDLAGTRGLDLMDVIGALALSGANPIEFRRQVGIEKYYSS
ncbi:hypothetical protein MKZ38_001426 [Zalerion maritima]|uniref:UDP-N-acetylglucosamine transferase subunit ALG13 n=1 Tax=Zalerion maritima TaxID=339359 RepID=A0AAD5RQ87_9PEZI|nr:hypothetical protein MKZ38_001426 [Zalerion maritima]